MTLARDIAKLCEKHYLLEKIIALDFFPHTFHIESFVLLRLEDNFDKCCSNLLKLSETVVITNGKEGSTIITKSKKIKIKPYPVQAIDTVGAGDTFAGAFLYGINNGLDFEKSANLASKLSSKVVTKLGPRLDKDIIESIKLSIE